MLDIMINHFMLLMYLTFAKFLYDKNKSFIQVIKLRVLKVKIVSISLEKHINDLSAIQHT